MTAQPQNRNPTPYRIVTTASTLHLHPEDIPVLNTLDLPSLYRSSGGYVIWTGYQNDPELPERVRKVLFQAEIWRKAQYVMFLENADVDHFFTIYDWEETAMRESV